MSSGFIECPACGYRLEVQGTLQAVAAKWNQRQRDKRPLCPHCCGVPELFSGLHPVNGEEHGVRCSKQNCRGGATSGSTRTEAWAKWRNYCTGFQPDNMKTTEPQKDLVDKVEPKEGSRGIPNCPRCGKEPTRYAYHRVKCPDPLCCAAGLLTSSFSTKRKAGASWRRVVAEYQAAKEDALPNDIKGAINMQKQNPILLPCRCGGKPERHTGGGGENFWYECTSCDEFDDREHDGVRTEVEASRDWNQWVKPGTKQEEVNKERRGAPPVCPYCKAAPENIRNKQGKFRVLCSIRCTNNDSRAAVLTPWFRYEEYAWKVWDRAVRRIDIDNRPEETKVPRCPRCDETPQLLLIPAQGSGTRRYAARCRGCMTTGNAGRRLTTARYTDENAAWAEWRKNVAEYQAGKEDRQLKAQEDAETPMYKTPEHKIAFVCLDCNRTCWYSDNPKSCPSCTSTNIVATKLQKSDGISCPGCNKWRRVYLYNRPCPHCGHDKIKQQSKQQEDIMNDISNSFKQTNTTAAILVKKGAKQAIGTAAEKAIMDQVKRMLGDQFPAEFYQTPLGEAVIDLGTCYLVQFATRAFPQMPAAEEVRNYAEHAMVGVSAKSFAPLMQMAQELFAGIADQAKLAGLQKPEDKE